MIKALGLILLMALSACSPKAFDDGEKFGFRKGLEHKLIENCGENNACVDAVKTQLQPCLEKADWETFLESKDDSQAMQKLGGLLRNCIIDEEGMPYFKEPS